MKLLTNGTGAYLTGDRIADAVVRLGVALSNEQRVDVVEIPYRAAARRRRAGDADDRLADARQRRDAGRTSRTTWSTTAPSRPSSTRAHRLVPRGDTPMSRDEVGHTQGYDGLL